MTVSEFRETLEEASKEMHKREVKEFYLIADGIKAGKFSIPEKYRGEFEPFFSGGDYGEWTANTAEFVHQFAMESGANIILMDYEIDEFLETLTGLRNSEAEEIEPWD